MSYILDALKKSEQARGGRKTRQEFEELAQSPTPRSRPSGSSRRWLYLAAFILFANLTVFLFWAAPWRGRAPAPGANLSGYQPAAAGVNDHRDQQPTRPAQVRAPKKEKSTPAKPAPHPTALASATATTAGSPEAATSRRALKPVVHGASVHTEETKSQKVEPVNREPAADAGWAKQSLARQRPSVVDKTRHTFPSGPPPAPGPRGAQMTATVTPQRTPAARQPVRRVEAAADTTRTSETPKSHQTRKTAVDRKAADLKAALEIQAERAPKRPGPVSRRENFAAAREVSGPDPASDPSPQVPGLSQLPPQVRETLPNISVSMLVYSKQSADRFIYINGTKRHEGDEVFQGLKVERITHDGAVFAYMGRRFYKSVLGY
ncbi:MAG: general secretion pathway protein GspB [Syntrophobacteraceae bacterium]|nr:general secretion pathway protein GspB [Syntrophobacteraceae bacterium]